MNLMRTILVAEDEPDMRNYLGVALNLQGYGVQFAHDGEEAAACVANSPEAFDLLLLDIIMPRKGGIETLKEVRIHRPDLPVIMLSSASSARSVVTALKHGADDFLSKPVSHQELLEAVERAFSSSRLRPPQRPDAQPVGGLQDAFLPAMGIWSRRIDALLAQIGDSEVPLLLRGETGVGKEVLARKFHTRSPRAAKPFLKLNCAALPSELVESELFGYERGAFTGAFKSTPGKFEMADGGTILLDEIGDMDVKLQAKLLQVLQDKEFLRLGAREPSRVDVRIMAATHCDLEAAISQGTFREDLFYRLNIVDILIPPLRERRDEILPLAEFFLKKHCGRTGTAEIPLVLQQALVEHDWPGNVRELENAMRKLLVLRNASVLAEELRSNSRRKQPAGVASADTFGPPVVSAPVASKRSHSVLSKVDDARKAAEADAILAALGATHWNRKKAAALLQIDYKALLYKMKKLGIGEPRALSTAAS